MKKILGTLMVIAGIATVASAGITTPPSTPEIGGASALSALTLISGAVLVIRSRKR